MGVNCSRRVVHTGFMSKENQSLIRKGIPQEYQFEGQSYNFSSKEGSNHITSEVKKEEDITFSPHMELQRLKSQISRLGGNWQNQE